MKFKGLLRAVVGFSNLCLVLAAFGCQSGISKQEGLTKLDAEYGCRGFKLGTSIEAPEFKKGHRRESGLKGQTMVSLPDERMDYEGVVLEKVRYIFLDGKLASIFLGTKGKTNSKAILAALRKKYGKGSNSWLAKMLSEKDSRIWIGSKVILHYSDNPHRFGAGVFFCTPEFLTRQKELVQSAPAQENKIAP